MVHNFCFVQNGPFTKILLSKTACLWALVCGRRFCGKNAERRVFNSFCFTHEQLKKTKSAKKTAKRIKKQSCTTKNILSNIAFFPFSKRSPTIFEHRFLEINVWWFCFTSRTRWVYWHCLPMCKPPIGAPGASTRWPFQRTTGSLIWWVIQTLDALMVHITGG